MREQLKTYSEERSLSSVAKEVNSKFKMEREKKKITGEYINPKLLGRNLKHIRQTLDLTQSQLSAITGVSVSQISSYEHGKYKPKQSFIDRINELVVGYQTLENFMEKSIIKKGQSVIVVPEDEYKILMTLSAYYLQEHPLEEKAE